MLTYIDSLFEDHTQLTVARTSIIHKLEFLYKSTSPSPPSSPPKEPTCLGQVRQPVCIRNLPRTDTSTQYTCMHASTLPSPTRSRLPSTPDEEKRTLHHIPAESPSTTYPKKEKKRGPLSHHIKTARGRMNDTHCEVR